MPIQARDAGPTVRIRVTDFVPGVPAGTERAMFGLGARGANSPGHGIGLPVSDRLLRQYHGTITIVPTRHDSPGCTVIVELPGARAEPACHRDHPVEHAEIPRYVRTAELAEMGPATARTFRTRWADA